MITETKSFEVRNGDRVVVTGTVRVVSSLAKEEVKFMSTSEEEENEELLSEKDVYQELGIRGYQFSGAFRSIKSASITRTKGHVAWANNWVSFLDSMLQIQVLSLDSRGLLVPTTIRKLVIDTEIHKSQLNAMVEQDKRKKTLFNIQIFIHKQMHFLH